MRLWLLGLVVAASSVACARTPPARPAASRQQAIGVPAASVLLRHADRLTDSVGPGQSGARLLASGREALQWRLALVDVAQTTLDVQYYIWHGDRSGALFLHKLVEAADRGVHVRILVDDFQLAAGRKGLEALAAHEYIEVARFNPFRSAPGKAGARALEIVGNRRLDRRMHVKLLVADGAFAITGGRNIGDEYFDLHHKDVFVDLDVLVAGPVVAAAVMAFDGYWNSPSVVHEPDRRDASVRGDLEELRVRLADETRATDRQLTPSAQARASMLAALQQDMRWGPATLLVDQADIGRAPTQVSDELRGAMTDATDRVLVVSPYLAPSPQGLDELQQLDKSKVWVGVLTNSLATNDVVPAHTAYKQYRRPLLDLGVQVYELRPDARGFPGVEHGPGAGRRTLLHAKVAVIDERRVFIGTFNLDPRSRYINTEMMLRFDNREFAREVSAVVRRLLHRDASWALRPRGKHAVWWLSAAKAHAVQPASNFGQRLGDWFFGFLPIENMI